jgi:hypothetical protein
MNTAVKNSLHAIKGALLFPLYLYPAAVWKVYAHNGFDIEVGWGAFPKGLPSQNSPLFFVTHQLGLEHFQTGISEVVTWSPQQLVQSEMVNPPSAFTLEESKKNLVLHGNDSTFKRNPFLRIPVREQFKGLLTMDLTLQVDTPGMLLCSWKARNQADVQYALMPSKDYTLHRIPLGKWNEEKRLKVVPLDRKGIVRLKEISLIYTLLKKED